MIRHRAALHGREETVAEIRRLADGYASDIDSVTIAGSPASRASMTEYYNAVRNLPYRKDTSPVEVVARPAHLFKYGPNVGLDCKKKTILMLAWAKKNNVPARIITSSRRPDKRHHHVFPQFFVNGKWRNVDATYPHYTMFSPKMLTAWSAYNA